MYRRKRRVGEYYHNEKLPYHIVKVQRENFNIYVLYMVTDGKNKMVK